MCSAPSVVGLDEWSNGWVWAGTSVKRRDAVDWSRSVVEEVPETVAVLVLGEARGGSEMEWASAEAKELLVGLGLLGEVAVLPWVPCSLDSKWFWV